MSKYKFISLDYSGDDEELTLTLLRIAEPELIAYVKSFFWLGPWPKILEHEVIFTHSESDGWVEVSNFGLNVTSKEMGELFWSFVKLAEKDPLKVQDFVGLI